MLEFAILRLEAIRIVLRDFLAVIFKAKLALSCTT